MEGALSRVSRARFLYLALFSKPKAERAVFRQIRRHRMARILEVGVGDARRASRLIQVAQRYAPGEVQYTGIDQFELSDSTASSIPLITVHRRIARHGANVRLVPGEPAAALESIANFSPNTDLIILSANITNRELDSAWFYLPRMLHSGSLVLREEINGEGEPKFATLSPHDVEVAAERPRPRKAA